MNDDRIALGESVVLSVSTPVLVEGTPPSKATVTMRTENNAPSPVDQTFELRFGGSATEGLDYTVTPRSRTLTIREGATFAQATIDLIDDKLAEGSETIEVSTSGDPDRRVAVSIRIDDNDVPSTAVSLTVIPAVIPENWASVSDPEVTVTGMLNEAVRDEPTDVVLTIGASGDTAMSGTDYEPVGAVTLTIPAGQMSGTASFPLLPVDDLVAEPDEALSVTGTAAANLTVTGATVTITDDDVPSTEVALSVSPATVAESAGATTVTVSGALDQSPRDVPTEVVLTVGASSDTATSGTDYAPVGAVTLTIPVGQVSGSASFVLTPNDDDIYDPDEVLTVAGTASNLTVTGATVAIDDDDEGSTEVALMVNPATVAEDAGTTTVTVTGTLDRSPRDVPTEVALTVGASGDAAISGTDYAPVGAVTLTIPAGQTSGTASFLLAPENDDIDESDETLAVSGTTAANLTVTGATVTLTDDDMRGIAVTPTALSVTEKGESGEYTVRLLSAPDGVVTVRMTVSGGGAVSVSPYELTFTGRDWNQARSVTVTAAEDPDVDPDSATVTHAVSGADYGSVTAAPVVVSVTDSGPSQVEIEAVEETLQAVTAGSLSNVTTNIGARFSAARSGGAVLTLAGQPVIAGRTRGALSEFEEGGELPVGLHDVDHASPARRVGIDELLRSSTFELSLNAADNGSGGLGWSQWTLWGRGDILVFDSDPSSGASYDGDLKAGYLGLDAWINGRWLVGMAASRTQVDADYRLADGGGQLDVTLTGLHPYVRFAPDGRRELWAILGAGTGEIENTRQGAPDRESTDVEMYMAAAGARQALEPTAGGIAIALLGDAGFGRLNGDAGTGLQTIDNLAVDTWRARAGAEVSYTMTRDNGASITPFAEIAGRVDGGGDEDTKAGVEVSAGVSYADPASGLGVEARGRTLVLYSGGDYQEYGASLTASLSPGAGGEGLSLALSPRLGMDSREADMLWREDPFRVLNTDQLDTALSLDAVIGYGVAVPSVRGLVTPFGELRVWHGDSRRTRAGVRFGTSDSSSGPNLEVAGARHEDRAHEPEHRLELIGRMRF